MRYCRLLTHYHDHDIVTHDHDHDREHDVTPTLKAALSPPPALVTRRCSTPSRRITRTDGDDEDDDDNDDDNDDNDDGDYLAWHTSIGGIPHRSGSDPA